MQKSAEKIEEFLKKALDKPHNVRYNISKLREGLIRKEYKPMIQVKKILITLLLIIKLSFTKVNKKG